MKLLLIGWIHHKNLEGIRSICNFLNIDLTQIEHYDSAVKEIDKYDIIYSPAYPIYNLDPDKKYIFGPHFSVFPNDQLIRMIHSGSCIQYILPCRWTIDFWIDWFIKNSIELHDKFKLLSYPFPVNTERFKEIKPIQERNGIMLYYKSRDPQDYSFIYEYISKLNLPIESFSYSKRYKEEDYIASLQRCRYGIFVDAHESQGFAVEEAMSCNLPLLVWSVRDMNQEYGSSYPSIPATTVPYWDERCGEVFYTKDEFEGAFNRLTSKLETYRPREYILENLSLEVCANHFKKLIE